MSDAQNERTRGAGRHRSRLGHQGRSDRPSRARHDQEYDAIPHASSDALPDAPTVPPVEETVDLVRPDEADAPTDRLDVYCVHHMAMFTEHEPFNVRTNMTALRHLAVDRFGEATLYCDCLHNGPHEWPPTLQRLQTAVELDQFLTDSTSEA